METAYFSPGSFVNKTLGRKIITWHAVTAKLFSLGKKKAKKKATTEVLGIWFYYPVWKGCIGYLEWILDLCFVIEETECWLSAWAVFYCQGVSEWPGWSRNLSPKLLNVERVWNAAWGMPRFWVFQKVVALPFSQHCPSNDQITEPGNGLDWKGP